MALAPLDPDRSSCGDRISSSAPALAAFEACGSGAFGSTAVWIHWPLATGFPLAAHRTHWLPTGPTGSTAHWPAVGAGWLVGASEISAPGEVASEIAGARRAARRSLFSSLGGRQVGRHPERTGESLSQCVPCSSLMPPGALQVSVAFLLLYSIALSVHVHSRELLFFFFDFFRAPHL